MPLTEAAQRALHCRHYLRITPEQKIHFFIVPGVRLGLSSWRKIANLLVLGLPVTFSASSEFLVSYRVMRLRYIFRRCWCQHLNCACEIDYCKNYEHEGMLRLRLIAERQKKPEPRMTDAHTNLPQPKHGERQVHALVTYDTMGDSG